MNCDQARDKLIDLAYGELPAEAASAVEAHLRACPACAAEWRRLRLGRAAMGRHLAGEPASPVVAPAQFREEPARRRLPAWASGYRRWLAAAAGFVAVVAVLAIVLNLPKALTPTAQAGQVEIKRLNVSLTILSRPADWAGPSLNRVPNFAGPVLPLYGAPQQATYQLDAVNNNWDSSWGVAGPVWRGLALVRDQRVVRNLAKGVTEVAFTDVPAGILPDTVRLRSLDDPDGLTILEQNYQYDLASAGAVLKRHVDRPVTVVFKAGGQAEGNLLSFDARMAADASLVVQPPGAGPRAIPLKGIKALRFARLPEGLRTRPTLLWQLRNAAADRQQFEVAYMTHGLSWRADYVLKLRPTAEAPKADQAGNPRLIDTADLVGYATVANHSGVTYADATLKLLAGDVNLIRPPTPKWEYRRNRAEDAAKPGAGGGFKEKAFFEYHLYTLGRRTTLRDRETKQIHLISGAGLKLRRAYVYDRNVHASAARVVSEFKNSEADGLGKPLPKGVVRLYAPAPDGVATYVGKTEIDHTPADEKIRLPWGHAFDIVCSARRTAYRANRADVAETWQYALRNRKAHDVTITVIVRVPRATYTFDCKRPWHIRQVGVIEIDVPVKAKGAQALTVSYRHNYASSTELKSPYDE